MNKEHSCCGHSSQKPWFLSNLFVISAIFMGALVAAQFIIFLNPFYETSLQYLKIIFLPILLGVFIGGLIDAFIPKEYISKHLSGKKKRSVGYSVGFGFLMSACSHGILAISMELYKKGASASSVISLLLASPWANLPVTILLFGFFGMKALLIILSAIVVAIITGYIIRYLELKGKITTNPNTSIVEEDFSVREDIFERFKKFSFTKESLKETSIHVWKGMKDLLGMILFWIILGVILAGLVSAYVPHEWMQKFLGPHLLGLLGTLFFATVLEVCSEGTAPLAFEIYKQTGAFGNAFIFLMAGVVTDVTEVGLIWKNIGKKAALWMLVLTLPQIIFLGWLFNLI